MGISVHYQKKMNIMIKLDSYEYNFINKKLETAGPAVDFQNALIMECLEFFQCCIDSGHKNKMDELCSDEFFLRMVDLVDRSTFYDSLYSYWDTKLLSKDPGIFTIENAIHTFYPIFCQEAEGPLKKSLLAVDFILRILNKEEKLTWSNFPYLQKKDKVRPKYITEVLDDLRKSSRNTKFIKEVVEGLDSQFHPLNIRILRNAGAHSDYAYEPKNDALVIGIESKDPVRITAKAFFELFSMTTDIIKTLHVIIHLGCRRRIGHQNGGRIL